MVKLIVFAVLFLVCFQTFSLQVRAAGLSKDEQHYAQAAFAAVSTNRWSEAHMHAQYSKHTLLIKILKWMDYVQPESNASFTEIAAFLRENPHWPQQTTLIRRAEDAITLTESPAVLRQWFRDHSPLTPNGKVAWVQVLQHDSVPMEQVTMVVREAWLNDTFSTIQEKRFLTLYGYHLRSEDHVARLDRLLWNKQVDAARRMLSMVDSGWRALTEARIMLADDKPGINTALAKVPTELRNNPGLLYERVRWHRRKGLYLEAISLLSGSTADKGKPDMWWTERAALAREALTLGKVSEAYEVARTHGALTGVHFAESEWLAGWIALRWLKDAKRAHLHFTHMYEGVFTPISLSRAAYWAGRAAEAVGHQEEAICWYRKAAPHVTSYYGQLAVSKLNGNHAWGLPEDPLPTATDVDGFDHHELVRVVTLLTEIGQKEAIRPFILRLGELAKTPGQHALAAKLAANAKRPDIAVALARCSAQSGVILVASGYPLIRLRTKEPPEHALVLAIIRQESNFHAGAVSITGARGLMQLMPATAKQIAAKQSTHFTVDALMTNPEHNIKLGTAFLGELIDSFRGSYVLTIAAYNAGQARSQRWLQEIGDPNQSLEDAVDWIESIPFSETRNYVQRVLEGMQIYRRRLEATQLHLSLENDLQR